MEHVQLGRTGLPVSKLCLGTMTFGLQCDEETSFAILDAAAEAGITFLDTADVYPLGGDQTTVGRTEEIVGRWMRDRGNRDGIILATKCAAAMGPGPNDVGLSRYHIHRAVDESLRRLGTHTIDLYQVHSFDPRTPIEETMRALDDVVRSGKARYIGCSNYPAWRLGEERPATRDAWATKFWAADAGSRIGTATQHLHGGMGVDMDYPIHRYFLWAKQLELELGAATPTLVKLGADMARTGPEEKA